MNIKTLSFWSAENFNTPIEEKSDLIAFHRFSLLKAPRTNQYNNIDGPAFMHFFLTKSGICNFVMLANI